MSITFEALIERAKREASALKATLGEIARTQPQAPKSSVPEIDSALQALYSYRNAYLLTQPLEGPNDLIDGRVEGLECAIQLLGGKLEKVKRSRVKTKSPPPTLAKDKPAHVAALSGVDDDDEPDADTVSGSLNVLGAIVKRKERGATYPQLALATQYARRTLEDYTSALRRSGLIEKSGKAFVATDKGRQTMGPVEPLDEIEALGKGERAVLDAIAVARHGATYPFLSVMTGLARRSLEDYVAKLKTRELATRTGGRFTLTQYAIEQYGKRRPKPETDRAKVRDALPDGESVIFEALEVVYPDGLTYAKLEECTAYARRSLEDYIGRLKTRELVEKQGSSTFVLSRELFA